MSDKDNGFSEAAGEGAEFALQFGAGDGVECTERLVHQKNWGIGSKGTSDPDALALTAGKFAGAAMRKFSRIEADEMEQFLDARGRARRVPVFQSGNEGDILCNREMREEAGFLDDVTDAAAETNGVPFGGGAVLDADFPLRGK